MKNNRNYFNNLKLSFSENLSRKETGDLIKTKESRFSFSLNSKFSSRHNFFFSFLYLLILSISLLILFRSWYLQIAEGKKYRILAEGNRIRFEIVYAPRGLIYASQNEVLARNIPGLQVSINPYDIDELELEIIIDKLSSIISKDKEEIRKIIAEGKEKSLSKIILKSNIDHETEIEILSQQDDFKVVSIEESIIRDYKDGPVFSHVIGYTGELSDEELDLESYEDYFVGEKTGKTGLEFQYEEFIKGTVGQKMIEVDSQGNEKKKLFESEPLAGNSLVLNIDYELQNKTYALLKEGINKFKATGGVGIFQDVNSGKILTLVSLSSFDNNLFAKGISSEEFEKLQSDKSQPLFNRAVIGSYPAGSTVKPLVGAAALEEGIISTSTLFKDEGVINIGEYRFPDWKVAWGLPPNGSINVINAISESCDTFFYAIGGGYGSQPGLGIDRLQRYAQYFGLGIKTGIDLPGENTGLYPSPQWKEENLSETWFLGDTYWVSIGQSYVLTTPIQVNNYISTIGNGGTLYKPKVVDKIINSEGELVYDFKNEILNHNFISVTSLDIAKEGMRKSVTEGVVWPLRDAKYPVAAKTGTAEFGKKDEQGYYDTHAWVTGFFPYEDPQISFTIFLESGGQSNNSAEIARDIINWYYESKKENK